MVKISFDASKMGDCAATASAIAAMLRQASSAVSSAYGALDSRVSSRVSGLSGASSSLDSAASEASRLSFFLSNASSGFSILENGLLKSISGVAGNKLSKDAIGDFRTNKQGGLGGIISEISEVSNYVKGLPPEQVAFLQAKAKMKNSVMGVFDGSDKVTPEYAQMMLLSGDASQMEQASKSVSEGTNTKWVSQSLVPFLNDVGNAFRSNINELASVRSFDDLGRYAKHTGASALTVAAGAGEALMKFGENIKDGIEGAFANTSATQLEMYGALDSNDRNKALSGVAERIKVDNTSRFWNDFWNSETGKDLDVSSYFKHDGAFVSSVKGATTLAGYVGLSIHPIGWAASAASIAGESYEHTLNEGGTLNDAIVAAAPMVLLDAGLNVVGGNHMVSKAVRELFGSSFKSGANTVKSGVKVISSNVNNGLSDVTRRISQSIPDFSSVASKTKAAVGDFTSAFKGKLVSESGFIDLGRIFGRSKKALKKAEATVGESPKLYNLPKKEGYVTLTEGDFDDFSREFIKKLEDDPSITNKPTKEKVEKVFWQKFSNIAENTYFEKGTLNYLDSLIKDDNMVVAIHKTGNAQDSAIRNIMEEGLYVNGASLQGATQGSNVFPGITRTATFVFNKNELAESLHGYYVSPSDFSGIGSRNSIVVAYPKGLTSADVAQCINGQWSIKPEYIVGYVPAVEKEGITSVESMVRNPKWYGNKGISTNTIVGENELIDASKLPLSDIEEHRILQEKWMSGESMSILDGRDSALTRIGNYDLKSDHAYRATSYEALEDYMKNNAIRDNGSGKGYIYVNWYIGGASPNYGKVIIEAPAKKSYFTLTDHYGGVMSGHPFVRQAYTSNTEPMPFDEVTKIIFLDPTIGSKIGGKKVLKIVDTKTDDVQKGIKEGKLLSQIDALEYKKSVLGDSFSIDDQNKLDSYFKELNEISNTGKYSNGVGIKFGGEILSLGEIIEKRKSLVSELEQYAANHGTNLKEMGQLSLENISSECKAQAKSLVSEVYGIAEKEEPDITKIMQSLENDTVHLAGLEHKLKEKESLERKIITDAVGKLTPPVSDSDIYSYLKTAADEMSDTIRYTLIIDETEYVAKVKESLSILEQKGYTINKFKNFWGDKKYQGINVQIVTPDGFKFELQFHTEQSLEAKEKSHFYYDIARNSTNPLVTEDIMNKANQVQAMDQALVKVPEGALDYKY